MRRSKVQRTRSDQAVLKQSKRAEVKDVCREHEISDATYYHSKSRR